MGKITALAGNQWTLYQIDAFADKVFSGNPAAVLPLEKWLPEDTMQDIAMENNLSETAFVVKEGERFAIRWFTPTAEVDLCGHATLATAFVIFRYLEPNKQEIEFDSRSGPLFVTKKGGEIRMDFPKDPPQPISKQKEEIDEALSASTVAVMKGKDDILAIMATQSEVEGISPDFGLVSKLNCRGLIVSATGENYDFVSRCFYPNYGVNEDPVTGSAHCLLTPYWSEVLDKKILTARQLSRRGGSLTCKVEENRVYLSGTCVPYMIGKITLP